MSASSLPADSLRIVGIAGSLRAKSYNAALLNAATRFAGSGATIEIASIAEIPPYNFDVEERGIPEPVAALKERIATSDGVLMVTPEYNNSLPGVLKNAIDWLTRPADDIPRIFYGRAIAIIGASDGPYGTIQAQTAWLPVVRTLRMRPWFGARLAVSNAHRAFDDSGALVDPSIEKRLRDFVEGFVAFVRGGKRP